MVCFLLLKNNPTTNRHILTSVKMPGYKVPLTTIIFAVLIGISDVNSDIFEGPWPYKKPTRSPELPLRCSGNQRFFIGSTYSWWTTLRTFLSSFWNLPRTFSKVRFGVVEKLLVASHEVSQINTLHAFDNTYDIWRRAQYFNIFWITDGNSL